MKRLLILAASLLAGLIVYVAVFVGVLHRPLTVDVLGEYVNRKAALLMRAEGPKIMIFAGSNGRFSHSCEEIVRATGTQCVNLSISAGMNYAFQFRDYLPHIHRGDVVYLPLEYRRGGFDPDQVGAEAPYLVFNEPREVFSLYDHKGIAAAFLGFDFRSLVSSVGEMVLAGAGVSRRFGTQTLNEYGDEIKHSVEKSMLYRNYVDNLRSPVIDPAAYVDERYWTDVTELVATLHKAGAIVVGGLPTTFEDAVLPERLEPFLEKLYASRGACFFALPNRSQYPRSSFFDTSYHLHEESQRQHSRSLAPFLQKIITTQGCAGPISVATGANSSRKAPLNPGRE